MKLNMVGMGLETSGRDSEGLEVLGNFRIRTLFHAKYGTPIFLEAMSAGIMSYYYMKGGRRRMYKKPRKVSSWGMKIYAMRCEGSDPCNEYRLYDDIVEGARYTEKDLLEWVNTHFGTNFDGIYIADQFDEFNCDMYSEDWTADEELHDKREAVYKKYYEHVKETASPYFPYKGWWVRSDMAEFPCLSVAELTPNTMKVINHASVDELEYNGLEREVILEAK